MMIVRWRKRGGGMKGKWEEEEREEKIATQN
jgi:hypothetical protein